MKIALATPALEFGLHFHYDKLQSPTLKKLNIGQAFLAKEVVT